MAHPTDPPDPNGTPRNGHGPKLAGTPAIAKPAAPAPSLPPAPAPRNARPTLRLDPRDVPPDLQPVREAPSAPAPTPRDSAPPQLSLDPLPQRTSGSSASGSRPGRSESSARKFVRKVAPAKFSDLLKPDDRPKTKLLLPPDASQLYGDTSLQLARDMTAAGLNIELELRQRELDRRLSRVLTEKRVLTILFVGLSAALGGANAYAAFTAAEPLRLLHWAAAWGADLSLSGLWWLRVRRSRAAIDADRAWVEKSFGLAKGIRELVDTSVRAQLRLAGYASNAKLPAATRDTEE